MIQYTSVNEISARTGIGVRRIAWLIAKGELPPPEESYAGLAWSWEAASVEAKLAGMDPDSVLLEEAELTVVIGEAVADVQRTTAARAAVSGTATAAGLPTGERISLGEICKMFGANETELWGLVASGKIPQPQQGRLGWHSWSTRAIQPYLRNLRTLLAAAEREHRNELLQPVA